MELDSSSVLKVNTEAEGIILKAFSSLLQQWCWLQQDKPYTFTTTLCNYYNPWPFAHALVHIGTHWQITPTGTNNTVIHNFGVYRSGTYRVSFRGQKGATAPPWIFCAPLKQFTCLWSTGYIEYKKQFLAAPP